MYSLANTLVFLLPPPVSVGVGSEIGQICGVFSSKDSKNAHFFDLLNGYIHPNNFKNKNSFLGLAPNPTHLRGRRGRWQTLSTYPYGECCRFQGVKGKMHDFVALDPSPSPWGSKTNRSGAGNPSRLAKQPRSGLAFTGWRRPNACGKGAGGFSLHPCHVANAGVGSAHGVGKTLGGRAVGENVP